MKGDSKAYIYATKHNKKSTIQLLQKEFDYIEFPNEAFNEAAKKGNNELLLLFKQLFYGKGDYNAYNLAAENRMKETIILLKNEFPYIDIRNEIFEYIAKKGNKQMLYFIIKEFPNLSCTYKAMQRQNFEIYYLLKQLFPKVNKKY